MTLRLLFICLIVSLLAYFARAQSNIQTINQAVGDFHFLYQSIRNGEINHEEARTKVQTLLPQIKDYYIEKNGINYAAEEYVFPVEGYGANMIGGHKGSDYIPGKYNFYNTHGNSSHPAHDIFINDRDQDSRDDQTNNPVKILSMTGGVVVSTEHFWDTTMTAKGGNYIYIYEPFSKKLYYYAHNETLWIGLGEVVKPGQHIADMGRTGRNANKKRSPTHLHFSVLQFEDDGSAQPVKPYTALSNARKARREE